MDVASRGFHKSSWHHYSRSLQLRCDGVGWIFAEQNGAGILGGHTTTFPQRLIGHIGDVRRDNAILESEERIQRGEPLIEFGWLFFGVVECCACNALSCE